VIVLANIGFLLYEKCTQLRSYI
jgi:hypothetical protein